MDIYRILFFALAGATVALVMHGRELWERLTVTVLVIAMIHLGQNVL